MRRHILSTNFQNVLQQILPNWYQLPIIIDGAEI